MQWREGGTGEHHRGRIGGREVCLSCHSAFPEQMSPACHKCHWRPRVVTANACLPALSPTVTEREGEGSPLSVLSVCSPLPSLVGEEQEESISL